MQKGEIVIYKTTDENNFQLEVRVEDETVMHINLFRNLLNQQKHLLS